MLEPDVAAVLTQFNRLIEELLRGSLNRTKFRPWEIEILVDVVSCDLPGGPQSLKILREYQNAVQRQIQEGARMPVKLSEYLELHARSHRFKPLNGERVAGASG